MRLWTHYDIRFINNHWKINDDGEFSSSYKYICLKELKLKLKHQGEHVAFLYLDITIEDNIFVYKFFEKRDKFTFCAYVFSVEQYSTINILWFNFFIVPKSRLCTQCILVTYYMLTQRVDKASILGQIKKSLQRYPETFSRYCNAYDQIINKIIMY